MTERRKVERAMRAKANQTAAKWRGVRFKDNRLVETVTTAMPGEPAVDKPILCWCGELSGHDWDGKAEGDPHPRRR